MRPPRNNNNSSRLSMAVVESPLPLVRGDRKKCRSIGPGYHVPGTAERSAGSQVVPRTQSFRADDRNERSERELDNLGIALRESPSIRSTPTGWDVVATSSSIVQDDGSLTASESSSVAAGVSPLAPSGEEDHLALIRHELESLQERIHSLDPQHDAATIRSYENDMATLRGFLLACVTHRTMSAACVTSTSSAPAPRTAQQLLRARQQQHIEERFYQSQQQLAGKDEQVVTEEANPADGVAKTGETLKDDPTAAVSQAAADDDNDPVVVLDLVAPPRTNRSSCSSIGSIQGGGGEEDSRKAATVKPLRELVERQKREAEAARQERKNAVRQRRAVKMPSAREREAKLIAEEEERAAAEFVLEERSAGEEDEESAISEQDMRRVVTVTSSDDSSLEPQRQRSWISSKHSSATSLGPQRQLSWISSKLSNASVGDDRVSHGEAAGKSELLLVSKSEDEIVMMESIEIAEERSVDSEEGQVLTGEASTTDSYEPTLQTRHTWADVELVRDEVSSCETNSNHEITTSTSLFSRLLEFCKLQDFLCGGFGKDQDLKSSSVAENVEFQKSVSFPCSLPPRKKGTRVASVIKTSDTICLQESIVSTSEEMTSDVIQTVATIDTNAGSESLMTLTTIEEDKPFASNELSVVGFAAAERSVLHKEQRVKQMNRFKPRTSVPRRGPRIPFSGAWNRLMKPKTKVDPKDSSVQTAQTKDITEEIPREPVDEEEEEKAEGDVESEADEEEDDGDDYDDDDDDDSDVDDSDEEDSDDDDSDEEDSVEEGDEDSSMVSRERSVSTKSVESKQSENQKSPYLKIAKEEFDRKQQAASSVLETAMKELKVTSAGLGRGFIETSENIGDKIRELKEKTEEYDWFGQENPYPSVFSFDSMESLIAKNSFK